MSKIANDLKFKIPESVISAFILIAALACNDAVRAVIDYYVPEKYKEAKNVWFKVYYAITFSIILIIAVIIFVIIANKV